jgi:ORF6N domain-containing protein
MAKTIKAILIPDEIVMNKIYFLRGQKVMLDEDLAQLYQVVTRRLNEQVKRNISRFPEDFMFQLTRKSLKT